MGAHPRWRISLFPFDPNNSQGSSIPTDIKWPGSFTGSAKNKSQYCPSSHPVEYGACFPIGLHGVKGHGSTQFIFRKCKCLIWLLLHTMWPFVDPKVTGLSHLLSSIWVLCQVPISSYPPESLPPALVQLDRFPLIYFFSLSLGSFSSCPAGYVSLHSTVWLIVFLSSSSVHSISTHELCMAAGIIKLQFYCVFLPFICPPIVFPSCSAAFFLPSTSILLLQCAWNLSHASFWTCPFQQPTCHFPLPDTSRFSTGFPVVPTDGKPWPKPEALRSKSLWRRLRMNALIPTLNVTLRYVTRRRSPALAKQFALVHYS